MREGSLNCRYIKVGDRIGLLVRRDTSPDQMTETGAMAQTVMPDRIIEVIDLGEILEEIVDRIVGKRYRVERYGNNNNRDRNRSREREHL